MAAPCMQIQFGWLVSNCSGSWLCILSAACSLSGLSLQNNKTLPLPCVLGPLLVLASLLFSILSHGQPLEMSLCGCVIVVVADPATVAWQL